VGGCDRTGSGRGVNGTLCKTHYLTEAKRKERGAPPLRVGEVPRGNAMAEGARCFVCGRNAKRRGRYVYLCGPHGIYEHQRIKKGRPPYGSESDIPPGFDGPVATDETEDEAKIDRLLAARRTLLDDREELRALDPWFLRSTWWGSGDG